MTEIIICSAVWYKDLPTMVHLPKNIDVGTVVCGHRHHNCIHTVFTLCKLRSVTFAEDAAGEDVQGFLTNTNRFVDRYDGMEIAIACGQVGEEKTGKELYSEDLY